MISLRIYSKYSDKYALHKLECNLIRVYTALSITMGGQNLFTQALDTMLLDFFSLILLHFSVNAKKNRINKILELFKII